VSIKTAPEDSSVNTSEEFLDELCRRSFLTLWSYPTPQGKNASKELCDCLIVCDPDVIIFSVKDITLIDAGDPEVNWQRWQKRAIDESVAQLYGAARFVARSDGVVTSEGTVGLPFPDVAHRRVHLVAVALGGRREGPICQGDFGKGFVHVFDDRSLAVILGELDTITDFVQYLRDKEAFTSRPTGIVGADEDILAMYLHGNRTFPKDCDIFIADETCWTGFAQKPEYLAKREADRESYGWDRIIELLSQEFREGYLQPGLTLGELEQTVRVLARECRFSRRVLARQFAAFLDLARRGQSRARIIHADSGVTYVFLRCTRDEEERYRLMELNLRCLIARGMPESGATVVGITVVESKAEPGFSLEVHHLHQPNWNDEDASLAAEAQRRTGYFANTVLTHVHDDEYPQESPR
jgi:hypothetical protein